MPANRLRLALDEHISRACMEGLQRQGFDAVLLVDVGRTGMADAEHLAWATSERRLLVTHDNDYLGLANANPGHAGVAYCYPQKYERRPGALIAAVVKELGSETQATVVGQIFFL